ncbi:MAG: DNA polymerase III subunit alpha, partial [Thermoguttaceae bacterium]
MYAELHCKTNFSFLEGASHPDEIVCRAAELGYHALAITDRNSLAGVVRAHGAAKDHGLKLIVGAEITPDDAPSVVLWATDRASYGRLSRLITLGRRRAPKGECRLRFEDVAEHCGGLLAGIRGEGRGERREGRERDRDNAAVPLPSPLSSLPSYRDLFGNRCSLLAELHYGPDDRGRLQRLLEISRQTGIPLAAAGDVHYHVPEWAALHDVLTAVRHNCTVAEVTARLFANAERHLKSPEEMAILFADAPHALRRTIEIAEQCTFSLDQLRYEYPEELAPPGMTPHEYLSQLAWAGAAQRWPRGVPPKVRGLLEHELQLIAELHYEAYFLTVWDLVQFARRRGILCQGRGSAANSAVCYCLGVTSVDPERMDVLFERFVSRERNEAPDIDVDFEHERREEVLQYLYEKYGRDRAGITAETITYRPRSAVRDVGKALGLPAETIDAIAKHIEHSRENWKAQIAEISPLTLGEGPGGRAQQGSRFKAQGSRSKVQDSRRSVQASDDSLYPSSLIPHLSSPKSRNPEIPRSPNPPPTPTAAHFAALVDELIGFPRHLSQHTGGMVITRGRLDELVPIENAAMPDRTVIEWNKDDLDKLGILKVDCLALGMLTAVRRCFDLIERHYGRRLTLADVPEGDQEVYAMIRRADTMGVFQIESRAQMSMLPRLQPRCFYDLVIEVAIVRPGPIQGNMVHPYLRRRNGDEPVTYPNDAVRGVLEKTLGVPLFQEQAMRLAVVAAGFTPGEADQLRHAMGAWRRPGVIDQFRQKLLAGMQANGFSQEYAEAVFGQIRGFGDYGFPESHAASFALLVYVSAWLKCHYPAAFTAALLNSQPMGFYAPAQLVRNAIEHGVEVLPVDVNFSDGDCTLERSGQWAVGSRQWTVGRGQGEIGLSPLELVSFPQPIAECCLPTADCRLPTADSPLPTAHCPLPTADSSLRLGFNILCGIPSSDIDRIIAARRQGPFTSFDDFARRTRLGRAAIARLAKAGTFESLALSRRTALWESLAQDQKELPLFEGKHQEKDEGGMMNDEGSRDEPAIHHSSFITHHSSAPLPPMSPAEEVLADYRAAGLSLRGHPLAFLRTELAKRNVVPASSLETLPDGSSVSVAGIVLVRQRPGTAKGITFVTLEDETGTANLIVRLAVWR